MWRQGERERGERSREISKQRSVHRDTFAAFSSAASCRSSALLKSSKNLSLSSSTVRSCFSSCKASSSNYTQSIVHRLKAHSSHTPWSPLLPGVWRQFPSQCSESQLTDKVTHQNLLQSDNNTARLILNPTLFPFIIYTLTFAPDNHTPQNPHHGKVHTLDSALRTSLDPGHRAAGKDYRPRTPATLTPRYGPV